MQTRVVERDHGVRGKRNGRHPILVAEIVAEQHQGAEVEVACLQRDFDPRHALVRVAGLHQLAVHPDEDAS